MAETDVLVLTEAGARAEDLAAENARLWYRIGELEALVRRQAERILAQSEMLARRAEAAAVRRAGP